MKKQLQKKKMSMNQKTKMSEAAIQQQCCIWFWNSHPELRGLLFMVNNNSHSKYEGALLKALGLIAGVSDLLFIYNKTVHCIEMKTPTGYQSDEQIEWQENVESQGVSYYIARSLDEFKLLINKIINEKA
jgi:VRR-NUC domain